MSSRGVLSPLTNTPVSRRPPTVKYISPSTSRQTGLTTGSPSSSLIAESHDDEKEKRDRRRSRIIELQRQMGTSPGGTSPSDRRGTPLKGLNSSQLADHYTNCIQLSAENKINSKNAFGLHLIDLMQDLLKKKELENFQVASSTLDASAKIYAGRVDNIHSETYKVLSGLGTGSDKQQAGDEDDEPAEEGEKDQKRIKKTKKKIVRTNLKAINVSKFDLQFEVDPMFQVMSATFDEGGASGLLLNHLRCYDDEQLLLLDSGAEVQVVEEKGEDVESQPKPSSISVEDVKDMLESMKLEEKQICPALSEFRLTGWDANEASSVVPKGLSEFAFDPHGEVEAASASEDDLASLPDDLDPDDLHDISDGDADAPDDVDGSEFIDQQLKGDTHTADFIQNAFKDLTQGNSGKLMQILAIQPSDYSYFNQVVTRTWAGPAHWKTASMSKNTSSRLSKSQKTKSKRQPFRLTYEKVGDMEMKFKSSKSTTLSKALHNYSKKKTTLPEDLHFQADQLFRLFLKPKVMIKRQETEAVPNVDDGIGSYDYDNVNDRENFCPALRANDDDDDGGDMAFDFSEDSRGFSEASQMQMSQPSLAGMDSLNSTSLTGDKLLSQPYKVAKIDITYAKTAKRVDVRKLKSAMWNLLTTQPTESQEAIATGEEEMLTEWQFQSLLQALPNHVSTSLARNLSVPIAFVCLLHLANEKTLKVLDKDMSDLVIGQDLKSD